MSRRTTFGFALLLSAALAAAVWLRLRGPAAEIASPTKEGSETAATSSSALHAGDALTDQAPTEPEPATRQSVVEAVPTAEAPATQLSTFIVEGRLLVTEPAEGPFRVFCEAQLGSKVKLVDTLEVGNDGTFGPTKIALLESERYRFRLDGEQVVPDAVLVDRPEATERVWIELQVRPGCDLWLQIVDESGEVLRQAEGIVAWTVDNLRMERRSRPREDGFIRVQGCPSQTVYVEGHCPGYQMSRIEPLALPLDPPFTYLLTLERAATVRGRCTFQGKPVKDFEVVFWPSERLYDRDALSFADREDGTFEIDAVPLGSVSFLATSARQTHGDPRTVQVTQAGTPMIELELSEPLRGKGRVISQHDGEPLADASVLPYSSAGYAVSPWGPPRKVEPDGSFDFPGFAPGHTTLRVAAPGFGTAWDNGEGIPGETLDFGIIALARRQDLIARLVAESPVDFSKYTIHGRGPDPIGVTRFSDEGVATVPSVSPGHYTLFVDSDDHEYSVRQELTLEAGEDWTVEFPGPGYCRLRVRVIPEPGEELPKALLVGYRRAGSRGEFFRALELPDDGRVEFGGARPGSASVEVIEGDGRVVASSVVSIGESDKEVDCEIQLSGTQHTFRVVTEADEPVEGARVVVHRQDHRESWTSEYTNGAGECVFSGLAWEPYLVSVFHQSLGSLLNAPVQIGESVEPILIPMRTGLRVTVQFLEEGAPRAGLSVRLSDAEGWWDLGQKASNADGTASWTNVGEGSYLLKVEQEGFWPSEHLVAASSGAVSTPIEVFGLGNFELRATTADGIAIGGLPIELAALSFDMDVGKWIEQGAVTTSTGNLQTDARGSLRIERLPRGTYQWRLAAKEQSTGLVKVIAGETVLEHVVP